MSNVEALIALGAILPIPTPENEYYGYAILDCMRKIEQFIFLEPDFQKHFLVDNFVEIAENDIDY